MLLNKHIMRRTTSMRGLSTNNHNNFDDDDQTRTRTDTTVTRSDSVQTSLDSFRTPIKFPSDNYPHFANNNYYDQRLLTSMVSPRPYQHLRSFSSSSQYNFVLGGGGGESDSNFLRSCGFCNRRLSAGRDIYMYRGDTAFCSEECRELQMKKDERKEKCGSRSKAPAPAASKIGNIKEDHRNPNNINTSTKNSSNSKSETVAAA